jgi:hypothetical protein
MMISTRSVRTAAAGAVGAGALTGAMLFGGIPVAQAAPAPAPATSFATAGPHDVIPAHWGHHWWHHGWGHHHHFLWHHQWWHWWW